MSSGRPDADPAPRVASLEVEGLPPGHAARRDVRPAPPIERLPRGARAPRCSRAPGDRTRAIETEHFRYQAARPAAGRLWQVMAAPVSASARYYIEARGEPIAFTCPLASLPAFISQTERELAGYWGMALDTRRSWD